jgi:hypothetical protein
MVLTAARSAPYLRRVALAATLAAGCPDSDGGTDTDPTVGTGTDPTVGTSPTESTPTDPGGSSDDGGPAPEQEVSVSGVRRLTRDEYDNTVRDLLGETSRPGSKLLPEDIYEPFDNDFTLQLATTPLIDALEALARDVAFATIADPARKAMVYGCTPTGPGDVDCMRSFIATFGRRAFRRPLTDEEIDTYAALAATYTAQTGKFDEGACVVIRAMLQAPEFVYRVEIGAETDQAGVFRLGAFEVATRLSYFLWGTTPDDELLDLADGGGLTTPEEVREQAEQMLADPRARDRFDRFHAMWLGYFALPHAADLTTAMRVETRLLIEQVVFDQKTSWYDLFTATGTYLNDLLAANYGLPAPGSAEHVWVDYGDSGRQGLLSQGSFLSVAGKFGDTSPTQRGKLIRTRLMCQIIPPPPPDVNVDDPPTSPDSNCKVDRYAAHRNNPACSGCHALMDPVGFGLENFDQRGTFRLHDTNEPTCLIDGAGAVDGMDFNGPAELADMLIAAETLDACAVTQLYRLATGHREQLEDMPIIDALRQTFRDDDHRFDQLVLALVSQESFLFRRDEP